MRITQHIIHEQPRASLRHLTAARQHITLIKTTPPTIEEFSESPFVVVQGPVVNFFRLLVSDTHGCQR
jgi:S1-C subfamily serine protease